MPLIKFYGPHEDAEKKGPAITYLACLGKTQRFFQRAKGVRREVHRRKAEVRLDLVYLSRGGHEDNEEEFQPSFTTNVGSDKKKSK